MSAASYRLGVLLSLCAVVAWSTAGFFTRLIPFDSFTILFWRGIFGAIGIFALMAMRYRGETLAIFRSFGRLEVIYMLLTATGMTMFIVSLNLTSVAHNAVIYATIPFVSAILGYIHLKEKPSATALGASIAALFGVVVMMLGGGDGGLLGDILSFVMTITMGYSIILARGNPDLKTMPAVIAGALLGSLIALPFGTPFAVDGQSMLYLVAFGIVSTALGNLFFALGSRRIAAIETALIGALDAPLAPLWVWIAFNETPGINTLIGGGIVLCAVFAHILLSRQPSTA